MFADEGADVAVNYIENAAQAEEVVKGVRARGRKAIAVQGDVAKRAEVEAMVDQVWNELAGSTSSSTTPASRRSCRSSS